MAVAITFLILLTLLPTVVIWFWGPRRVKPYATFVVLAVVTACLVFVYARDIILTLVLAAATASVTVPVLIQGDLNRTKHKSEDVEQQN